MPRNLNRASPVLLVVSAVLIVIAGCEPGPSVPAEDFETTVIGTIQPGQIKRVEEEYSAGRRVRGVIYVGFAELRNGNPNLDPDDLASVTRGGVSDIVFRVEDGSGNTVLDLGLVASGTEFEFVADVAGQYFFVFDNTSVTSDKLKAFSMGANEVVGE